jgi:AcrR family transcriptional regulator
VLDSAGLRERKRAEARRGIAAAARRLALERGPDSVTVADIAEAADVSPRTVFNHFATKDEAILGSDPRRRAALGAAIVDRPSGESALDALRAVLVDAVAEDDDLGTTWRQRAELVHRHPSLLPAQLAAMADLESAIANALAVRTGLDADVDLLPRLAAAVSVTVTRTAIAHALATGRDDLAGAVDASLVAVLAGLGTRPPVRRTRSARP